MKLDHSVAKTPEFSEEEFLRAENDFLHAKLDFCEKSHAVELYKTIIDCITKEGCVSSSLQYMFGENASSLENFEEEMKFQYQKSMEDLEKIHHKLQEIQENHANPSKLLQIWKDCVEQGADVNELLYRTQGRPIDYSIDECEIILKFCSDKPYRKLRIPSKSDLANRETCTEIYRENSAQAKPFEEAFEKLAKKYPNMNDGERGSKCGYESLPKVEKLIQLIEQINAIGKDFNSYVSKMSESARDYIPAVYRNCLDGVFDPNYRNFVEFLEELLHGFNK